MAWYQRSYFNLGVKNLVNLLLLSFFVYFILTLNVFVQNFSLINATEYTMKELTYKGITFKCSNLISNNEAFLAVDNLIQNINLYNSRSFTKYYKNNNGILISFESFSCYSHFNMFIGSFNDVSYNYQFTHKNYNNSFFGFTDNDIIGGRQPQLAPKYLHLYHNSLAKIYLNQNNIFLNNQFMALNKKLVVSNTIYSKEVQNYIQINSFSLNDIIFKSLKI